MKKAGIQCRGIDIRKGRIASGGMNKTRNNAGRKTREQDEENIMEIILSKQCESLMGSLGKGYGYYIRRAPRKDGSVRFFSQRSKHPPIPRDGHLRFIFACANLALM